MYSIEKGLLGIYFHEFSHFISHAFEMQRTICIEEGIAELVSYELIYYFNNEFSQQEIIEKKTKLQFTSINDKNFMSN